MARFVLRDGQQLRHSRRRNIVGTGLPVKASSKIFRCAGAT